jgi:hypothetical protein
MSRMQDQPYLANLSAFLEDARRRLFEKRTAEFIMGRTEDGTSRGERSA